MLTIIACVVLANFALRCRFSSKIFVTEKYFRLEEDSASWFLVCLSFYIGSPAVAGMYSFSKSRSRRISLPAAARSPCSDSSRSRSRLMSRWQVWGKSEMKLIKLLSLLETFSTEQLCSH